MQKCENCIFWRSQYETCHFKSPYEVPMSQNSDFIRYEAFWHHTKREWRCEDWVADNAEM